MEVLQSLCRCCPVLTTDDKDFVQIDEKIRKKIIFVVGAELKVSNDLPTRICYDCHKKIIDLESFKLQVLTRQKQISLEIETCKIDNTDDVFDTESPAKQHQEPQIQYSIDVIQEYDYGTTKSGGELLTIEKLLNETSYQCAKCEQNFSNIKKLSIHLQQLHNIFQCDECDLSFKTKWQFLKHSRILHRRAIAETKELKTCQDCGKVLKGNNHLNFHIKTKHLNLTKFSCDLCDFRCYGKYEIRSHIEIHHLPLELRKEFPCDMCSSILTTSMGLKIHKMHKHSKLKPHQCFCGKSYSLKETLKTHIRNVHNGLRKFKCQQCDKGFNSNIRLSDHVNNYHGTKQKFTCDKCNKTFNSSRNLQTHSIYHKTPPLSCKYCDKKFFIQKNLVEHEESVHMGITHDCEKCKRSFQSTSGLRRHSKSCN